MAKFCIYMHRNKINGKVYIGQTCDIKHRWQPKCYQTSSYFYNAIEKYGWENFEHIILEDNLTLENVDEKENYYINKFSSLDREFGYNLKSGGALGCRFSKEIKDKISQSNKEYYNTHKQWYEEVLFPKCHEATKKSVICINTGEIFESQIMAAKFAGLKNSTPISRCCRGERKTAGKHPITKERLKWCFNNKE